MNIDRKLLNKVATDIGDGGSAYDNFSTEDISKAHPYNMSKDIDRETKRVNKELKRLHPEEHTGNTAIDIKNKLDRRDSKLQEDINKDTRTTWQRNPVSEYTTHVPQFREMGKI